MPDLWRLLFLASAASALYLAGVIWCVQIVVYPQMAEVGAAHFSAYHAAHARRMTGVVLVPMVVDLGASGLLALLAPPDSPRAWLFWAGFALAALTWAVTFFVSVPLHGRLSGGFDAPAHRALVRTNWLRTVLWTAHAALVLALLV